MTLPFFDYPKSAFFGRVLPKCKIFDHISPNTTVKELFTRQVKQITWEYKLAPETINIPQTKFVSEIEIFTITLKGQELSHDVLSCIDKAIPLPLIFELHFENKVKTIAAYKHPNEVNGLKMAASKYFETPWLSNNTPRSPLPISLDLEILYSHLLSPLFSFPRYDNETLQSYIKRMELISSKQQEAKKCKERLRKEKQFNRKVPINAELRSLNQLIEMLTSPLAVITP